MFFQSQIIKRISGIHTSTGIKVFGYLDETKEIKSLKQIYRVSNFVTAPGSNQVVAMYLVSHALK
jgi:hypothetical protein